MRKLFLVVVCAISALTVSAQRAVSSSSSFFSTEKVDGGVQFGIRAGINFANITFKEDNNSISYDSRASFHVGVIADIPLMQSLYIQTGLYLQNKGAKYEETYEYSKYKEEHKPMYLQIPLLASYRYDFSDAVQLQVNVGPYFAYGIGGKAKWIDEFDDYDETWEGDFFGDKDDEDTLGFKRFDCGLQVGGGLTFAQKYYLGVTYEFGFGNISNYDDIEVKNKNLMVSLGYNF